LTQADTRIIRFVDLCAGLGGFHRGLSLTQQSLARRNLDWRFECVLASELDPELRSTYLDNFPDLAETYSQLFAPSRAARLVESLADEGLADAVDLFDSAGCLSRIHGDLRALVDAPLEGLRSWPDSDVDDDWIVPEHDLLCAGFPCQPFSKSGSQLGFSDTRGTVFHLISLILRVRRPALVLLENVGNFDRHDEGNTWQVVWQTLSDLGYDVRATRHKNSGEVDATGLLSPHHIGLPHHRERFFIIAQQRGTDWLPALTDRTPFPSRPTSQKERMAVDEIARTRLRDIVAGGWDAESGDDLEAAQIPRDRVTAVEHWNKLLAMLAESDRASKSSHWRQSMPSFPIWGYELDPFQWYPIDVNPHDRLSNLEELSSGRARLIEKAAEAISVQSGGATTLLSHPPQASRSFLDTVQLDPDNITEWISTLPAYAIGRRKWPDWKTGFIRQNRAWAIKLWAGIDSVRFREWLDALYRDVPAASNQKLEWNCKNENLDLWQHVLQFRPSGLRVKRLRNVPALVAMTTTQIPIVPRLDPKEPVSSGDPRAKGRHLLRSEALQLQGFPRDWHQPSTKEAAFRAFGNAVHCELVAAILETWLTLEVRRHEQLSIGQESESDKVPA
jgi:DNA (cytosine-5)-methyltransferase 1